MGRERTPAGSTVSSHEGSRPVRSCFQARLKEYHALDSRRGRRLDPFGYNFAQLRALHSSGSGQASDAPTDSSPSVEPIRATSSLRTAAGWALFLLGAGAIAWAQWNWTQLRLRPGLPWMLGGILLVLLGCALRPQTGLRPAAITRTRRSFWLEAGFLVALTVFGGIVRFVGLDHVPPGGFFDEVQNHLVAEDILKGDRPIFIAEATQMP